MSKGRIRLVKVKRMKEEVASMVYLENYKMIAVSCGARYVKFYNVLSGKLEMRLDVGMPKAGTLFLIKEKNCLGVADSEENIIKIIQLHGGNWKKRHVGKPVWIN